MQQTNKYELNKPGLDDPVAIASLNENMDKLEAALIGEAKARADGDADEVSARTAAIQAEASARVSAVNAEISARTAAVNAEASTRANADTTETNARVAADKAEAKTRADADTAETNARTAADTALAQRVTALEAKHFLMYTYAGDNSLDRFFPLGFTPTGGLYRNLNGGGLTILTTANVGQGLPNIVQGGFRIYGSNSPDYNAKGATYHIIFFN